MTAVGVRRRPRSSGGTERGVACQQAEKLVSIARNETRAHQHGYTGRARSHAPFGGTLHSFLALSLSELEVDHRL